MRYKSDQTSKIKICDVGYKVFIITHYKYDKEAKQIVTVK